VRPEDVVPGLMPMCNVHAGAAPHAFQPKFDSTDPAGVMLKIMSSSRNDRVRLQAAKAYNTLLLLKAKASCERCAAREATSHKNEAFFAVATAEDLTQLRTILDQLKAFRAAVLAREAPAAAMSPLSASVGERPTDHEPPASQE
jgi:hypothetical protein